MVSTLESFNEMVTHGAIVVVWMVVYPKNNGWLVTHWVEGLGKNSRVKILVSVMVVRMPLRGPLTTTLL